MTDESGIKNVSAPRDRQGEAGCKSCGAGFFRIGTALDALEQESTGLGAAFYWSLVRSLYRVMRIYDHVDALMYEEQLRDSIDSDDTANPDEYEFPEVRKALPPYIEQTLDKKWTIANQRLLSRHGNGRYGQWIRRLRTLNRLARAAVSTETRKCLEATMTGLLCHR